MDDVAAREVPVYFEVEEEIISAPSKVRYYCGVSHVVVVTRSP